MSNDTFHAARDQRRQEAERRYEQRKLTYWLLWPFGLLLAVMAQPRGWDFSWCLFGLMVAYGCGARLYNISHNKESWIIKQMVRLQASEERNG